MSDDWITPEERARGYERIIPFDREPIDALDEQEVGDLRCGCALCTVTFIRRDVFPILCECGCCGATWMRHQS